MTPTAGPTLDVLARRKAELGVTTSVVIPARDEGPRVGAVVAAVRRAMEVVESTGVVLVDELVVVDGASRDDTVAQAERAGARVVAQADRAGGKGAALQQGVAATSGDLVAFVDADVLDPTPELATATLGALLMDPALRLVKSAAPRAWSGDGAVPRRATGGGRVTELTVRPLLALLWPEVAHVAQPLSGEYAADRALLEALPFERGYGVELGLLLDTLRTCGPGAIGEVDLPLRAHPHQPLDALGRMARELVEVVADRLEVEGRGLDLGSTAGSTAGRDVARSPEGEVVRRAPLPPLDPGGAGRLSAGRPLPPRRAPSPGR